MKKLIAIIAILTLLFAFTGCDGRTHEYSGDEEDAYNYEDDYLNDYDEYNDAYNEGYRDAVNEIYDFLIYEGYEDAADIVIGTF